MPEESFELRRGSSNRKSSYRESTVEHIKIIKMTRQVYMRRSFGGVFRALSSI